MEGATARGGKGRRRLFRVRYVEIRRLKKEQGGGGLPAMVSTAMHSFEAVVKQISPVSGCQ